MTRNKRTILLLMVAVVSGLGAAMLMQNMINSRQSFIVSEAEVEMQEVVIVKVDLPLATTLSPQVLETREWPAEYLPEGAFLSIDDLDGRVVRRAHAAGELVRELSLLAQGSTGGLESVIAKDYRAVSVKVDPIVGVAGFVTPGSRVDVLATVRRVDWQNKQPYAKAVLQNVKVLAIDQKLEEVGGGDPQLVSVVTLEVKPKQAEELTFMSHEGKLQLALRGPTDEEIVKTRGVTVSRLLQSNSPSRSSKVEVVKGVDVERRNF
jgi:pilus assembly protein CpaB